MNKSDKLKAWLLFGLAGSVVYLKHRLDAITMRLQSIGIVNIDTTNRVATLNLVVDLIYPLPFGLTLKTLTGDLYIMGKRVAVVKNVLNRYLSPSSVTPITITVDVDLAQLAEGVLANIQTGNIRSLLIQLDARATTNLLPISLHKTFVYDDLI